MSIWTSLFKGAPKAKGGTADFPSGDDWLMKADENPRDPVARHRAGEELARRGDKPAAVRNLLAAADLYMTQGFAVKAMAALVSVLQVDPENDDVHARIVNIARDEELPVNRQADLTIRTRLRAWTPLFSDFTRSDLTDIIRQMSVRRFEEGEVLLAQGEIAKSLSVLMDGSVRILTTTPKGEIAEIGRLRHGDFFGESSVLLDLPTPATLEAESEGELLVWPREAFDRICAERPALRAVLERFHEERAHQAVDAVVARFHKSA